MATPVRPPPVCFLVSYGAEDFFLDRDIERARRFAGYTSVQLDGTEIDERQLVSLLEQRPFDEDCRRVVILDNANKVKADKILKAYVDSRDPKDTFTILVAIVRDSKLSSGWAHVASKGKSFERKKLKTFESDNEVVKWMTLEATNLGLKLDEGVADMIFALVGANLYRISGEIQKVRLLVGGSGTITKAHVASVLSPAIPAEPWQVAEAAAGKDRRKAMNLVSTLYKNGGEEVSVPVVYGLMRQVEKLVVARQLLDRKVPEDEIAARLGMHPYRFKQFFLPQVRKHDLGALVGHMARLCKLDADVKGSARSKRTQVELAILAIAG